MKPAWVVWDWNGTLLDDTHLCYEIGNEMRMRRGLPAFLHQDAYRAIMGFPIVDYYRRMGYTFENETYDDVSGEFVCMYMQRANTCKLHAGAERVLGEIAQMGVRQVMLSATGQARLNEQVAHYPGLAAYFADIIGMPDNLAHGKASLAQALLERERLSPGEVLFIGDTDHDFAVASAVGCRAVLIANGHQTAEKLHATGAPVLGGIAEVPGYLETL